MSDDSIVVEIQAAVQGLLTGMSTAASAVEGATAEMTAALETVTEASEALMKPMLALFAVFESFHILTETISKVVETGEELQVMSEKTGMSVESLSRLQYAAKQSSVSNEALDTSLTRLARNMEQSVRQPTGRAALAFKELGIQVQDGNGHLLQADAVLPQIANKFSTMSNATERAAYAQEMFGRGGTALLPMLNQGASGIKRFTDESDRLGQTWSKQDVAATEMFRGAMVRLKAEWDGFIRTAVINGIPYIESLGHILLGLGKIFEGLTWAARGAFDVLEGHWSQLETDADSVTLKWAQAAKEINLALHPQDVAPMKEGKTGGDGTDPVIEKIGQTVSVMEKYEAQLNAIKIQNAANYGDMDQIELQFWNDKLKAATKGSKEYMEILARVAALAPRVAKENDDTLKSLDDQFTLAAKNNYEIRKANLEAELVLHKDNLQQQREIAEQLYVLAGNQFGIGSKEQLEALSKFYAINNEISKQTTKDWTQGFALISSSYEQTIQRMTRQAGTWSNFMKDMIEEIGLKWGEMELKTVLLHNEAWAARLAKTAEGVAITVAQEIWGALKAVGAWAAAAAAAAWSAIASIPYVGPYLAPAVAAGTLAGVLALGSKVASAAGGYDIPSGVNPMTQLHAQEMVLPANLANGVRSMVSGSGGGGGTIIVQALDSSDVKRFMSKNAGQVAKAAWKGAQNGVSFRQMPGRRS